jgi:hypothetical protein
LLGDWLGLKTAMLAVFVTLAYILGISVWARPLVKNEVLELGTPMRRRLSAAGQKGR